MAKILFNRERSDCFGKVFSAVPPYDDSFLSNLANWIVRPVTFTPVIKSSGGPGWYMIDNTYQYSPDGTDHYYIVVSNHQDVDGGQGVSEAPNKWDEPHKVLQIGYYGSGGGYIQISGWLWWDAAGVSGPAHTGYHEWFRTNIDTLDDGEFIYDFRGGPRLISIAAKKSGDWDGIVLMDWDPTNKYWGDQDPTTVGAVITNSPSAGTTVTINFLDYATASQFQLNKYYAIIDFNGNTKYDFVKVVRAAVPSADNTIEVDRLLYSYTSNGTSTDLSNPVMSLYPHRYIVFGDHPTGGQGYWTVSPYCTFRSTLNDSSKMKGLNGIEHRFTCRSELLFRMNRDDNGNYWAIPPVIHEFKNNGTSYQGNFNVDMNHAYGIPVETYYATNSGITQMEGGRNINGEPYIYAYGFDSGYRTGNTVLIPDYDYYTT